MKTITSKVRAFAAVFAAAVAITSSPILSQDAEEVIVVEGSRKSIARELDTVLSASEGQLARFEDRLCPAIYGFDAEYTRILLDLVRRNAADAGIEVEPDGCTPTAIAIFTDQPQALVQGLRARRPMLFAGMPIPKTERLLNKRRSHYGWRRIDMKDRDGVTLESAGALNGTVSDAKVVRNANPTRLSSNVRFDIVASYLVLDITRTPGMQLNQIADFITLNLLFDMEEEAAANARIGSILTLFDAPDPTLLPARMGRFERGMLEGFYKERTTNYRENLMRARIAKTIEREP